MAKMAAPPPSNEEMRQAIANEEMRAHLSLLVAKIIRSRQWGWASWIRRADVADERRQRAVRNLAGTVYQDLIAALEDPAEVTPTTVGGTNGD